MHAKSGHIITINKNTWGVAYEVIEVEGDTINQSTPKKKKKKSLRFTLRE